jgi:hypothetical protein
MGEFIVSIGGRLGRALLQLGHLIGIKAQGWSQRADLIESLSSPVGESAPSRFYDPSMFPEAGPANLEEPGNLPEAYGETRVVLLPVHPYLIHAYWELTPEDLEGVKRRLGEGHGGARPILRFYDVTCLEFDGTNAHSYFDVEVDLGAKNWYVPLWSPEKSYISDLGFKREDGEYLAITRSNMAHTPRAWPSMRSETRYTSVGEERRDVETVPDSTPAGDTPAPKPAPGAGKRLFLPEIPPPVDAAKALSGTPAPLYGPGKGEGFPPKTDEPRRFDFTEICERIFAPGLSSRSKGP